MGVDNGIHMVHRYRTIGAHARDVSFSSTARAIWFSTITTIVSFGSLAFSNHPGTASMGILLTIGMTASLLASLIVLPTLLRQRPLPERVDHPT